MPKLIFRVDADTSPVKKFRTEIEQIEKTMLRIKGENFSFDHWVKEFERLKTELEKKREQIDRIKKDILTVNPIWEKSKFDSLNTELSKSTKERDTLIDNAINLSNKFGKAYDDLVATLGKAQKVTDEVTARFIEQKQVVANLQSEVRSLNAEYKNADKGDKVGIRSQITSKQKELEQQRVTLNALKAEQERAKLAVKGLSDETRNYEKVVGKVSGAQAEANLVVGRFEQTLLKIGGLVTLQKFASDVIRVRGEFQKTQVAFETMLGSKEKADSLMAQMVETAAKTPFDLQGVADGAKQLLAYGTEAKDVNDTLIRLGNIASGLSIPLGDMVYLYGTTQTQGRLFTQDVRQFMGRGIPLVKELASMLGKTEQEINKMVTAGQIGFPEVEKVIKKMTDEGGQFYNLMEKQSQTLSGQISNLGDAWDSMLNSIGENTQGLSSKTISMATVVVEHYEEIGRILIGLIGTYGAYRAATIAYYAISKTYGIYDITTKELQLAATMKNIVATKALAVQQAILNKTMLSNPLVLVTTLVVGAAAAMWVLADHTSAAEKAQKRFNDEQEKFNKQQEERKQKIEELIRIIQDETETEYTKIKAYKELQQYSPALVAAYSREELATLELAKSQKVLNKERDNINYENIISNINRLTNQINEQNRKLRLGTNQGFLIQNKLNGDKNILEQELNKYKKQLDEYNRLKKQAEEDAKPVKVKLLEAENNREQILQEFLSAKMTLEEEQRKIQESGFGVIPIDVQIRFDNAKAQLANVDKIITALMQGNTTQTYKEAYNTAQREWKAAQKALVESKKKSKAEYIAAKKDLDEKEKAFKDLGGITNPTKQENQAEKLRKEQEKYKLLLSKQELDQIRTEEDLQMEVDEARIKAMDEGSAKTIAEMELNFEKEMQAIDRQKEDALRKKIEDARTAWDANPENKGKSFDATGIELSDNERKHFDELYKAAIANNEKAYKDLAEHYLSYADERLAIEKKFNDDISILQEARKKAEAKGDASEIAQIDRSVEKRTEVKNEDIFKLDAEQFKQNMDWEQVFGNLDKVSTDTLKKLKANLKDFISSQKDLSPENFKELVDAIERIDDKVSERNPFEAMSVSFKSLKDATDAQREAQEAYNKALEEGTDEEKKNAKATLESAKNSKQKALYEATDALHKGINEIGQYVDAGNQVIGIMETLGIKTPEWLEGTMSGFGEMLDGLGSIDLMKPMSIVTGGLQTIKGALTSITSLGGAINWSGSNAKEVAETINRLTERNEILGKSIDRLTDIMEKSAGSKAISAYEEARKNQQEKNENLLDIAQAQASYHNSHKSWQYYMRWTDEQLKWAQENVDASFTGTNSLWNLTPEQMNKLLSNVNIYEQIKNAGKGGYGGRVMEDLEEYAEQAGKIADLEASINESLMNVSFDSLRSSFLDSLMDMEKDAKGFSDDFSEMMQRALLDFSLGETFDNELKDWYNDVAKSISENSGKLSETQMDDFKKRYDDIVNAAMYERDKIAELTGYTGGKDSTREASQKGIATASQDSVDENNGRLAVMQGHTYSINENVNRMATGIDTIASHTVNLSCLTNIDKTMQSILSMRDASLTHLSNIDSHTARLEAIENAIVFMKNDINTMLIKGLKLSRN